MKKIIIIALLFAFTFAVKANPVDVNTAREVAVKFVNANSETPLRSVDELQLVKTYSISRGDAAFYVFNTDKGFVIVAADERATPILGYSTESRFDPNDIPPQLEAYLEGFADEIQYAFDKNIQGNEQTAQQWANVRSLGKLSNERGNRSAGPLLTDTWNQNCYYNNHCPEDPEGPCGHVYAGCAATSFSQIMHYWGYPQQGTGSHTYTPDGYPTQTANFGATTYDWANMPNSLSASSTAAQVEAISLLMWHCGVAVDMNYGPTESGGSPITMATSLKDYFGYSQSAHVVYRKNYTDQAWRNAIKCDLDLGWPVQFTGYKPAGSGHAFVCDGYDSNDLLHFNFGWGGNKNGYYAVGAVLGSTGYNNNNYVVLNIHPSNVSDSYTVSAAAWPDNAGTVTGEGVYQEGATCTLTAMANEGYTFVSWIKDGQRVSTSSTYSFTIDQSCIYQALFKKNMSGEIVNVEGTGWVNNMNLPIYSGYYYSLSQQIYTADEIGMSGGITNIAFYNNVTSNQLRRNVDIYMVHTDKTSFNSNTDWISVSESDKVFSGYVWFAADWMTISLDSPFVYDGINNLAIIVADRTNDCSFGVGCLITNTESTQSIYARSLNNYDVSNPTQYTGTRLNVKNQIKISFEDEYYSNLTVYNETDENEYVPVYGYYTDAYLKCEMVMPALQLSAMSGYDINKMKFYLSSPASDSWGAANFKVFIKEVDYTTISDYQGVDDATVVYEGPLDGTQPIMEIEFNAPYHYNGGNLLIGVYNTVKGSYKAANFVGTNVNGASVQGHSTGSLDNVSANQRNFLPKTTFTYYVSGGGSGDTYYTVSVFANPAEGGTVAGGGSYLSGSNATLTATPAEGYQFLNWTKNGTVVSENSTYSFIVTEDADYMANFEIVPAGQLTVHDGTSTNSYVPVYGAMTNNYNKVEMVYPASELTAMKNNTIDGIQFYANANYASWGWAIFDVFIREVDETSISSYYGPGIVVATGAIRIEEGKATINFTTPYYYRGGNLLIGVYQWYTYSGTNLNVNWYGEYVSGASVGGYGSNFDGIIPYQRNFLPKTTFFYSEGGNITTYQVAVAANPAEGGTVTGSGEYEEGESCTITETPNEGYVFVNWTKDGEVVSYDSSYTFVVDEDSEYVANFNLLPPYYHWNVDINAYPDNIYIVGVIRIEGIEPYYSTMYEVGAFVGDECRGRERPKYIQQFDKCILYLMVYGEDGDHITFRLYNHETEEEIDLPCPSQITFAANAVYGTVASPYILNFTENVIVEQQHVSDFIEGWNWWSTYIDISNIDGLAMLEEQLGNTSESINSQSAFTMYYDGYGWYGSLNSINNESMYRIKALTPVSITMTGMPVNPAEHPITISYGWNHIGFLSSVPLEVDNAFAGLTSATEDIVKNQNSYAMYYEGYGWYGSLSLGVITPGDGLMYKSVVDETKTFTYPANPSRSSQANVALEATHWTNDAHAYPGNMTMLAVVELDGEELHSDDYEIAAFADDGCRGSIRLMYVEPIDRYVAFLTVAGEEAKELHFALYNKATGESVLNAEERVTFVTDATLGTSNEPYVLHFRQTTGVDETEVNTMVYPNPTDGSVTIEAPSMTNIMVTNALGQVLYNADVNADMLHLDLSQYGSGIYMLRIHTTNGTVVKKLTVTE